MTQMNLRREDRKSIASVILPFLGTRADNHEPFQFLILDISTSGFRIAIPRWLVGRDRLKKEEIIYFHMPFRLGNDMYIQGEVMWRKWDDEVQGETYGIRMEKKEPIYDPIYISLETSTIHVDLQVFPSLEDLWVRLLHDMTLLKKGIIVYLKHLVPYFTRITDYRGEDYKKIKATLLSDIIRKVRDNQQKLSHLHEAAREACCSLDQIPKLLDLEELREMTESEINLEILHTTFGADTIAPYLNAIKLLEKKLYANYNMIVLLYLKSLSERQEECYL